MSYQDVKATFESKVKAGYDAGCYVATFEGGDKLNNDLCNALDVSAKASLAYFDGTEFGAFAAFSDYLHTEYGVSAEDCEFMYMMALKMQFKHMSNGGDLTEVLNSVKVKSGLDLFDKPKEEWTVNQKTFVMKLKHDEYYKAVLREIDLDVTPEEFWKKFAVMFPSRYGDISAAYLHFYSTLPAMIPSATNAAIPIMENIFHHICTIYRALVLLTTSGEMSLDPYVITNATICEAIAENPVIQFGMLMNARSKTPGYESFKAQLGYNEYAKKYVRSLTKAITDIVFAKHYKDASVLLSMNGWRENINYILWPIYNTWLDMEARGEVPTQLCCSLNEQIIDAQAEDDKDTISMMNFDSI